MKETTSLYNLLKRGVVIPNFQRDYAQGRAGKEDLRTKFLDEIWAHVGKDTAPLELDFVYGTNMDGKICPLDGQQRLTTIWLLMWYCKYKGLKKTMKPLYVNFISAKKEFNELLEGKKKEKSQAEGKMLEAEKKMTDTISDYLNQDEFKCLKNFSYDTRPSSKAFVEWLCDGFLLDPEGLISDDCECDLSKFIQQRSGFHSVWKQDPTVQSMLRMLKDINAKFKDVDLGSLFTDESPIQFYYLDLDGIKQSNNLYIKMNARGEQLTGFENFKADLVANLRKEEKYKNFVDLSNENYILKKWDVEWTGLFWSKAKADEEARLKAEAAAKKGEASAIDGLFFTFIKRFLLNEYILASKKVVNKKNENTDNVDAEVFDYKSLLYDNEQGEYTTYKPYELLIKKYINNIKIVLDSLSNKEIWHKIEEAIGGLPLLKGYSLLPKFMVDSNAKDNQPVVAEANFKERIVMYGICRYLQCGNFDETVFAHWLRVLANLAYYDEMANYDEFKARLEFVKNVADKLVVGNNFKDIYGSDSVECLIKIAGNENQNNNIQLNEEIDKIKLITEQENDVEKSLKELESLWIFEGNISCLLDDDLYKKQNLFCIIQENIGDKVKSVNKNTKLVKLFRAVLAKTEAQCSELSIDDAHNNLRKLLNGDLREGFVAVLKCLSQSVDDITSIIQSYKDTNSGNRNDDWKYVLIIDNDELLWKYASNGKVKQNGNEYFLFKGTNYNKANIPLSRYNTSYINSEPEKNFEVKWEDGKSWSVTEAGITFNETK